MISVKNSVIAKTKLVVLFSNTINLVMDQIAKKIPTSSDEYGMYLKAVKVAPMVYVVAPDYFVPEQEVTTATFTPTEGRPSPAFNSAIHRHPPNCLAFSGTDDGNINPNSFVSLLYTVEKGVFLANVNIETTEHGKFLAVETNDVIAYSTDKQLSMLMEEYGATPKTLAELFPA